RSEPVYTPHASVAGEVMDLASACPDLPRRRLRLPRAVSLASTIVIAFTALVANTGAARNPQQQIFRSGTEVVQLDVSVLDKDRRPGTGLTREAFTVFEDGKPQTIASFEAVDLPSAPKTPAIVWQSRVPRDVVTNQIDDRRTFVIVLDDGVAPM